MMGLDTTFLVQLEIQEAEAHDAALEVLRGKILGHDRAAALVPQVLSEFVHVVTDARRFERPLSMVQALAKANFWWNAKEIERIYPHERAVGRFLAWMAEYGLGRKRLLDTLLAATWYESGITRIVTSNARDYQVFGVFEVIEIRSRGARMEQPRSSSVAAPVGDDGDSATQNRQATEPAVAARVRRPGRPPKR